MSGLEGPVKQKEGEFGSPQSHGTAGIPDTVIAWWIQQCGNGGGAKGTAPNQIQMHVRTRQQTNDKSQEIGTGINAIGPDPGCVVKNHR